MVCAEVRIGKVGQLFRPQIDTLNTIKGDNALAGLIAGVLFPIADAAKNGLDLIGVRFLDRIPRPTKALTPDFNIADLCSAHGTHRSCRIVGIAEILLSTVNVCGIPVLWKESVQIGR